MALVLTNNAKSTLSATVGAGDLTLNLKSGEGAKFPVISTSNGDFHPVTVVRSDGSFEIMKVTDRVGDVLTVLREQEGTSALTFSVGDIVELRITVGLLAWFYSPDNQGSGSGLDADTVDGRDVSTTNTAQTIVSRDANGNFSAGTINAALNGNSATATQATTAVNQSGGSVDATTLIADSLRMTKINPVGDILDLLQGNVFKKTVTATTSFVFANPPVAGTAQELIIELVNGGSQTVNWPASVVWAGGVIPTLTVSGTDLLRFITHDGGTTWFGSVIVADAS
jgi:hypothetical protein